MGSDGFLNKAQRNEVLISRTSGALVSLWLKILSWGLTVASASSGLSPFQLCPTAPLCPLEGPQVVICSSSAGPCSVAMLMMCFFLFFFLMYFLNSSLHSWKTRRYKSFSENSLLFLIPASSLTSRSLPLVSYCSRFYVHVRKDNYFSSILSKDAMLYAWFDILLFFISQHIRVLRAHSGSFHSCIVFHCRDTR